MFICTFMLVSAFAFNVWAEPSDAAQAVIDMIFTLDDNSKPEQLAAVRDAYNALSDEDKAEVWNYSDIFSYEQKYALMLNERLAAIKPIEIDLYNGEKPVMDLLAMYNVLGDEAKALVTEYPKLEELVSKIEYLRNWQANRSVNVLNSTLNGFAKYDYDYILSLADAPAAGLYYYFEECDLLERGDGSTGYYDIDPNNDKVKIYKYAKLEMDIKFTDLDFAAGWPSFRTLVENVEGNTWTGFDFVNDIYFNANITAWGQGGFCDHTSFKDGNIDLGVWHHWVIIWDHEDVSYEMDGEIVYESKYDGGYEFLIIYPWNCNLEMTNVRFTDGAGKVVLSPFRKAHNFDNWVSGVNDPEATMLDLVEESVGIARDSYETLSDEQKAQIVNADQIERVQALIDDARAGKHPVNVENGSADVALAAPGEAVTITADDAPEGMVFDRWEIVSGEFEIADASASSTTFTMPETEVELKATFKDKPLFTPADTNGDGKINNRDVILVMKAVLAQSSGAELPSGFVFDAADMNGDGKLNNRDVIAVMKAVLAVNTVQF